MIECRAHREGILITVKAQPGARSNAIRGVHNGSLKIAVTQKAEKGKANDAIIDVLCQCLQLKKSQIELISGATSRTKQFLLRDIDAPTLLRRCTTEGTE